jgi:hypothetical protein
LRDKQDTIRLFHKACIFSHCKITTNFWNMQVFWTKSKIYLYNLNKKIIINFLVYLFRCCFRFLIKM